MSFPGRNNENKFAPTTGGKNNPKQIHIAHRRSPSELTNLMIEQFTLQRQLEIVQAQQQQLLAQQQQLAHQTGQYLNPGGNGPPPGQSAPTPSGFIPQPPHPHYNNVSSPSGSANSGNRSRSHSRNNSGYYNNEYSAGGHRRTGSQSSVYGHSRRHSLGLNEAKKAAAEEQAKRATGSVSIKVDNVDVDITPPPSDSTEQSGYKFPATPTDSSRGLDHRRSNSNMSPNRSFQFPARPSNNENQENDFIQVGTPHRRTNSRNQDLSGINSNWRLQQQQQQQPQPQPQQQQQPLSQQQQPSQSPYYHKKSHSRDFSGFGSLEPPPVFQPGHKSRGSNASAHSFSSNSGGGNSSGRKSLFAPYLPQANIPQLVQEGRLVAGILRVNKKNRSDAWVSTDGVLDADIFICGSKDRNRALEGDLVAVELLVVDDVWGSKKEKEEKKRRKDASNQHDILLNSNDDYHNDASSSAAKTNSTASSSASEKDEFRVSTPSGGVKRRGSLKQRPTQKKNDDVEVEGQSLLLAEEEEINDDYKPLYAGHVVAVLDRIPGQLFSGTLGLLRPSQQSNNDANKPHRPKIVWFKPTDKKVPLIAIPTEQAPKDFVENADHYADKLFVASIKRWPITSLHPFGTLVSQLGEINDPGTEIDAILRDNNFLSDEYLDPQDRTKERDTFQALELSKDQIESRRSFEDEDVFAITENASLSDFAIHIKTLKDGSIELGCHVVDVTAHIEEGSSLDRRARKRSSGVFMPQKTVHLLPKQLNSSLALTKDKLSATISVVYKIDASSLDIVSTWIGESTIVPTDLLTFDQVNKEITSGNASKFISDVHKVANQFYCQRLNLSGAQLKPNLALLETLDDEKVNVDLNILENSIADTIFDEIQRKVNSTVAEKIYNKLGSLSFLRRQAEPITTKLKLFKKKVQNFGYDVDITSASAAISSILSIEDTKARACVEILLFKTFTRAKYFIAGKVDSDQYKNYSLNLPLYTHFTAPLRRYADHVVHRQLKSVIRGTEYQEDSDSLKITSEYCNFKKDCAHHAQEQAIHLLLCKTINDMGNATGQLLTMATVLQVYESSFDIFIPEFGIEKRVHGDQLPLIKAEYDGSKRILELYWQAGVDSATFVPADEKNPKSYRNSIKNKFRSTSAEIAATQQKRQSENNSAVSDELAVEFSRLQLQPPSLTLPEGSSPEPLNDYLRATITKRDGDKYVQEIRELQQVPVLLRAEVGMALPCLTVRALNPFAKKE